MKERETDWNLYGSTKKWYWFEQWIMEDREEWKKLINGVWVHSNTEDDDKPSFIFVILSLVSGKKEHSLLLHAFEFLCYILYYLQLNFCTCLVFVFQIWSSNPMLCLQLTIMISAFLDLIASPFFLLSTTLFKNVCLFPVVVVIVMMMKSSCTLEFVWIYLCDEWKKIKMGSHLFQSCLYLET